MITAPVAIENDFVAPLPHKFYVETGNICNLRCPFCGTGLRRTGFARGFLAPDDFRVIVEKIAPYTDHVSLYNFGEPFLNKNFLQLVSLAAGSGVRCSTHSNLNAYAFDDESAAAVIVSGLHFLSASIDGASQETYAKYRVGGSFNLAISNLERLQQARERLGSATPQLVWKFLVNRFNENEQLQAEKLARSLGVPIEFHLMDVWGHEEWKSSLHKEQEVWGKEKGWSHIETPDL
ncbi:MAG: radical SAM protein, partial [Deltaproteobacteria bacterium]|nr:radical SAM protein [Deltaproteobacteria bacterium]